MKPGDLGERFHRACVSAATRTVERKNDGHRFCFRFLNGVPLNHANPDLKGNFLACQAVRPHGPDTALLLGHGRRHLATVFAQLMRRAFLIDPVPPRCGSMFRAARAKAGSSGARWERLRGLFMGFHIPDGEILYQGIAFGHQKPDRVPFDTS